MSHDDETPTEYFGPDVKYVTYPNGRTLACHPDTAKWAADLFPDVYVSDTPPAHGIVVQRGGIKYPPMPERQPEPEEPEELETEGACVLPGGWSVPNGQRYDFTSELADKAAKDMQNPPVNTEQITHGRIHHVTVGDENGMGTLEIGDKVPLDVPALIDPALHLKTELRRAEKQREYHERMIDLHKEGVKNMVTHIGHLKDKIRMAGHE